MESTNKSRRVGQHTFPLAAFLLIFCFIALIFMLCVIMISQVLPSELRTERRQAIINETRKNLQKMRCVGEVPDKLINKWIPKVSEFEGVDEYLQVTKTHRKEIEDLMYSARPEFVKREGIEFQMVKGSIKSPKIHFMGNCDYHDISVDTSLTNNTIISQTLIYIKNGELHIYEQGASDKHDFQYTRVYYIPDQDLVYNNNF